MHSIARYIIIIASVIVVGCDKSVSEQDFFCSTLSSVEKVAGRKVTSDIVSDVPFNPYYAIVDNGRCISYERSGDYYISVNDLKNGDLVTTLLRKGRGPLESTHIHPIFSINEGVISLFDSEKSALFNIDVERSIMYGTDSLQSLRSLNLPTDEPFMPFSFYTLTDDKLLMLNTSKGDSPILEAEPYYSVFDLKSGDMIRKYSFFKLASEQVVSSFCTTQGYLNNFDCISSDGGKLFFSMAFLPVCGVLDLTTGNVNVWSVEGLKSFKPQKYRFQFVSAACSSDKVYALYSGAVGVEKLMTRRTDLYVFDWEGNIMDRLILDKAYKYVSVSDGKVYLMDYDGYVYTVEQ